MVFASPRTAGVGWGNPVEHIVVTFRSYCQRDLPETSYSDEGEWTFQTGSLTPSDSDKHTKATDLLKSMIIQHVSLTEYFRFTNT